MQCPNNTRDII